jgi:hypothetical protein
MEFIAGVIILYVAWKWIFVPLVKGRPDPTNDEIQKRGRGY